MGDRTRAEIIAGLEKTVDRYIQPGEKVRMPIVKPPKSQTTESIEPVKPIEPKKSRRPTYIPPNLRGEDRRWLQEELKPPSDKPKAHHSAPMGKFWEKRAKKL
jgi:hypothetical protein